MKLRNYFPSHGGAKSRADGGNVKHREGKSGSDGGGGSGAIWSMSSLMEVLPDSPSPICSSPRRSSFMSESKHLQNELPVSAVADKREFLSFLRPGSDFTERWKQDCSSPTRQSLSTLYESTLTTMDQQEPNPCVGNPRNSHHYQELICQVSSSHETPTLEEELHTRGLSRPRPYQEFLDEVQTQQHGAEIQAWKRANQLKLQNKLRQKEAAITNWETEQKNKARAEMEIIERKIEIRRAKELKKMQQKIAQANKEAEKQRACERRAALKKMARVEGLSEKIQTTKCMICLKLQKLC